MWAFPSRSVVRILALLLGASTSVIAQSYLAGVRGAVRDATGVMVSVEVVLLNEETAVRRATVTNASGEYAFPSVAPGLYTIRAVATGFRTFESRGIRIGTQDSLTLDVALELGEVRESVIVTGGTPVIEQATASIGAILDRAALESLPNAGRNPFVLATTAATVLPTGSPQFVRIQDQNQASMLSVAGGPRRGNNYLLDGVPIGDLFNRAVFTPSIETVQEVKVQISTYDAELGRTGGGVFNTTFKSGVNSWRGSALYLGRPEWGTGTQFFTRKNALAKPDLSYHLWAGSFGGPVIKSRTFFWASTEGYDSLTTQNGTLTLPTALERRGDFSRSPAIIYDPRTTRLDPSGQLIRDPFPGNVIPDDRINPVARNFVNLLPLPANGRALASTASIADLTNQATAKLDHRLSDRHTLSGLFAWYHSNEPGVALYGGMPGDPQAGSVPRTVKILGLNAVSTPNEWTTVAIRYGYMNFGDDSAWKPNDPSTLDFDPAFARELTGFPTIAVDGYGSPLFSGGSGSETTHYSHSLSASWTRLVGRHALKAGADYRRIGMRLTPERTSGFNFTTQFTKGPDPNGNQNGDAMASFLLGTPGSGGFSIPTPSKFFTNYAGAFVQDDFRLGSSITINLGVRFELEQGLQEQDDAFTVGFDRDRAFPVQVPGLSLKGGLMYAGQNGYPTRQGEALNFNIGPRAGLAWSLGAQTVVRGGYGLFWAPSQIPQAFTQAGLGTRGFTGATNYVASNDGGLTPCPGCSLTNPFPVPPGLEQPQGAAQGLLTGAGGSIDFIDESSGAARVHRYSFDMQRQLPGRIALTMGYVGSRSEGLSLGGTVDAVLNINQLDPQDLALGTALQQQVSNPFFGNSAFGAFSTTATLSRGQLLRPYPQFGNVFAHRVTASRSRYDAFVVSGSRRQHGGWGASVNYTYSVLKDDQSGESNAFANNPSPAIDSYDLERQYGYSLRDTPHRLNISGTLDLPFGTGRRWLSEGGALGHVFGGWTLSAVGVYQSGFPIAVTQLGTNPAGAFGFGQRPNVVPGVAPMLTDDPADSYDPSCLCIRWLNPAAWSFAPAFTLGNAPHADPNVRTPLRTTLDVALSKTVPLSRTRLTLRAEVFNVFDQPIFFSPLIDFGTQTFGQLRRDGGFPRTLQLMARMAW